MNSLLLFCRPGFEKECALEIQQATEIKGFNGFIKARPNTGYVIFESFQKDTGLDLLQQLKFRELIFARQMVVSPGLMTNLPVSDRITPLIKQFANLPVCKELYLEYPDTNTGKSLSGFCKKFSTPFRKALAEKNLLQKDSDSPFRAHLFFLDSRNAFPAVSLISNSSSWELGIPRLKFPKSAPSRSTLKLDEAWKTFFSEEDEHIFLNRKMTAVDLGAAPGGWTWQFINKFIPVTAVDNGPMQTALMASGLVTHLKTDGFGFKPSKPVTWMVCDIVESPQKIAYLVSQWLCNGWCQFTVFNLKLPMKKRYQEVQLCRTLITKALEKQGLAFEFDLKHLYHDREEVTAFIRILGASD